MQIIKAFIYFDARDPANLGWAYHVIADLSDAQLNEREHLSGALEPNVELGETPTLAVLVDALRREGPAFADQIHADADGWRVADDGNGWVRTWADRIAEARS